MMAGSSSPQQVSTLTGVQRQVARKAGKKILEGLDSPTPSYSGQKVAPLTPSYLRAQDLLSTFNPNEFKGDQHKAVLRALSGESSFNLDPATTEKYFNDSVMTPLLRSYEKDILPQINAAYSSPGGGGLFSSRRGLARERALSDLGVSAAGTLASAQFGNQQLQAQLAESAANRQQAAIGTASQLAAEPLTQASMLFQAGAPLQQHAQALAASDYDEFLRTLDSNNPYLTQALGFLGSNQTALYNPQGTNWGAIGSGVGALAGGAIGLYAGNPVAGAALGSGLGGTAGNLFTQGGGTGGAPLTNAISGVAAYQQSQDQNKINTALVNRLLNGG